MRKWTLPDSYMGAHWPMHYVFLGQHRDSGSLTRSNFQVAIAALRALPEWTPPADCPEDDACSRLVVSENHWAVGWVEWIAIHESDAAAIEAAEDMLARLENYPVLDEQHFSQLEWDEAAAWWASMRVPDRLDALRRSKAAVSMFASRRDELPEDDSGRLFEYLTRS